jgi:tetratricopeptide (TPR) repeat protein
MASTVEIFFSYSHKDEALREELEKQLSLLKRQGFIMGWHDRRIIAGQEWEGEIDTHLNTAQIILLLISPDFMASDYCYDREMQRAMERHEAGEAYVIPIILRPVDWHGAPFGKLQALPKNGKPVTRWSNHDEAFLDVTKGIRAAVENFQANSNTIQYPLLSHRMNSPSSLKEDVTRWRTDTFGKLKASSFPVPFQAPSLSDQYVERQTVLTQLKNILLPLDGGQLHITRAALHGIGGVGKSVIASAFAHDEDVQRQFPDGVLWVTLGQKPDIPQRLSDWGRALHDPQTTSTGYSGEQTGTSQLRTMLKDKACLLIIDDAWESDHVKKAFLVGGPRCLLLVTTRKREIAEEIGAKRIELQKMSQREALALMEKWTGEITTTDMATANWLSNEVGYLPLALELIGAQVSKLQSWAEYRQRWEKQKLNALKRGRRAKGKEDNLQDSFELSLAVWSSDDRERYLQLGAFPEKAHFPANAAAALWRCDEIDASELLLDFAGQAMLTQQKSDGMFYYTFHDLLFDFVTDRLGENGATDANISLVEGYRNQCADGWKTGPNDGYFFEHLAYHLAKASRTHELYGLIDKPWMDAKFERTYSHRSFTEDVALTIKVASSEELPNLVQVVRGSLIYTTLGSLATNVPPEVLGVLAKLGQVRRALGIAALIQDAILQSSAYILITDAFLEHGEVEEARIVLGHALTAVEAIDIGWEEAIGSNLSKVAQRLSRVEEEVGLERALELAEATGKGMDKVNVLSAMARALALEGNKVRATDVANRALVVAEAMGDDVTKAAALSKVAQALAEAGEKERSGEVADYALAVAEKMDDEMAKAVVLSELARDLIQTGDKVRAVDVAKRAMVAVETIREIDRLDVLHRLARTLNHSDSLYERAEIADRALAVVEATEEQPSNVSALNSQVQALVQTEVLVEQSMEMRALPQIYQALTQAGELERAADVATRALAVVGAMGDEIRKAQAVENLAQALAQAGNKRIISDVATRALTMVETIAEQNWKAGALVALIQALGLAEDKVGLDRALTIAETVGDESRKGQALCAVVQVLAKAREFDRALAVAENIGDEEARTEAFGEVVHALAQVGEYDRALLVVEAIRHPEQKATALSEVAQALAEITVEKERAINIANRALAAAEAIRKGFSPIGDLNMQVEQTIGEEAVKANALSAVAQALAQKGKFDWALTVAEAVGDTGYDAQRAIAFSMVAYAMAEAGEMERAANAVNRALAVIEVIGDERDRAGVLNEEPQDLVGAEDNDKKAGDADWALAIAKEIRNARVKATILSWVAQVWMHTGRKRRASEVANRALIIVEAIGREKDKAEALAQVAEALAQVEDEVGLKRALALAEGFRNKKHREFALSSVVQVMAEVEEKGRTADFANQEIRFTVHGVEDEKVIALGWIAQALSQTGEIERAVDVANRALTAAEVNWDEQGVKGDVLIRVVPIFAEAKNIIGLNRTLAVAEATRNVEARVSALSTVAYGLIEAEEKKRAIDIVNRALIEAETIEDEEVKVIELSRIVPALIEAEEQERAIDIANRALAIAEAMRKEEGKANALGEAAYALAQVKDEDSLKRILIAAEAIGDQRAKVDALSRIAQAFVEIGDKDGVTDITNRALVAAEAVAEPPDKAIALSKVALALAEGGQQELALRILQAAFVTAHLASRYSVFRVLENGATILADIKQGEMLWKLYEVVQEVEGWWVLQ